MATIGGYRIGSPVTLYSTPSFNTTSASGSATVYTAPSNGFALLTVGAINVTASGTTFGSRGYITIAGNTVTDTGVATTSTTRYYGPNNISATSATTPSPWLLYLGPGQSISYAYSISSIAGAVSFSILFNGLEFING
jgi:hypothetical protein